MLTLKLLLKKIHRCEPNNDQSYTEAYQKHTYCSYGYKVVCCYDDRYSKPVQIYRGENASYKFMEKILEEMKWCHAINKKNFKKPLLMTDENEVIFATKRKYTEKRY